MSGYPKQCNASANNISGSLVVCEFYTPYFAIKNKTITLFHLLCLKIQNLIVVSHTANNKNMCALEWAVKYYYSILQKTTMNMSFTNK